MHNHPYILSSNAPPPDMLLLCVTSVSNLRAHAGNRETDRCQHEKDKGSFWSTESPWNIINCTLVRSSILTYGAMQAYHVSKGVAHTRCTCIHFKLNRGQLSLFKSRPHEILIKTYSNMSSTTRWCKLHIYTL